MTDSVNVTNRIASSYNIIYLTHRPDLLTHKSKAWLQNHGFPRGPLLTGALADAFGSSGKFKSGRLATLRESFDRVSIGIGDKLSDAQAYVDNGMTAYLIPHYKNKTKHLRRMARDVRNLRGHGRLQVVSNWREIEAGLFEGKKFPPQAFADWLEARAQERQRWEEEEDDDDDDD